MNRPLLLYSTLVLAAGVLATGCARKVPSTVPAFAQAVTLTATNVQGAFDTVQNTYYEAETLNFAADFAAGAGTDPSSLGQKWLPPEALAARLLILQGLKQYASNLSSLTAANSAVDPATTALSAALKGLAPDKAAAAKAQLPENIGVLGINALANWFIDRKLRKELPALIEKMDPSIQSISRFLIEDIGVVDADPEHPSRGSGLRQVLWVQYGKEITAWDEYVRKNYLGANVGPDARLAAIKQVAALARQRKTADQTMAQAAVTIRQMAQAHSELVMAAKTKQNLTTDLGGLLAEAQRLNTYYQSLAAGK